MNRNNKLSLLENLTIPETTKKKKDSKKSEVFSIIEEANAPDWFWGEDVKTEPADAHASIELSKREITADLDSYLKKGEQLMLKAMKEPKTYSNFLEQCADYLSVRKAATTNSGAALATALTKYLFRPMLTQIAPDMTLDEKQSRVDEIKSMYFPDIEVRLLVCDKNNIGKLPDGCPFTEEQFATYPESYVNAKDKEKAVPIVAVSGDKVCYGANVALKQSLVHSAHGWRFGSAEKFFSDDIAWVCAVAASLQFLSEQLSARKKELTERGQLGAFLPFDKPTQNLAECYISDDKVGGEGARVKWFKAWDDLRQMSGSIMAYILDSDPLVRPFAEAVSDYKFLVQAVSEEELDTIKTQELNPWVLPWERVVGSGMCEYMHVLHDGIGPSDICVHMDETRKHMLSMSTYYVGFAAAYVHALLPAVDQARQTRRQSRDYALSYQTKKNIPKATLEYMQQSGYNNYFGYVEVDEECDLEKISETYSIFVAFHEAALWWVKGSETVSLRFRRLGNHRALGLYYPGIRCLCVSAVEPSAFIHEYGHMIDSLYGDLSLQPEFGAVRHAYEQELKKLPSGSFGKGKYNIDYFLEPTEIFARSLEIYFSRVRGYKNALLGKCEGTEYPTDSEYMSLLASYFDNLIAENSEK